MSHNLLVKAEQILASKRASIGALCRKYAVRRLRLFGSALRDEWDPATSDFDFLAEFDRPTAMNAFDQLMGFVIEMEALLGRKVDVVDWNAAKNPFFKRHAASSTKDVYAS